MASLQVPAGEVRHGVKSSTALPQPQREQQNRDYKTVRTSSYVQKISPFLNSDYEDDVPSLRCEKIQPDG